MTGGCCGSGDGDNFHGNAPPALQSTCFGPLRYFPWPILLLLLLLSTSGSGTGWNGCMSSFREFTSLNVSYCYRITKPTTAHASWGDCTSLNFMMELRPKGVQLAVMREVHSSWTMRRLSEREKALWMGAREAHPGAALHVAADGAQATAAVDYRRGGAEGCLAMLTNGSLASMDCREERLVALCVLPKYDSAAFGAAAAEACGEARAVALLPPLGGCYEQREACDGDFVRVKVLGDPGALAAGDRSGMRVVGLDLRSEGSMFRRGNAMIDNTTIFCYLSPGKTDVHIRLELRFNRTMGERLLWAQNPGRAAWPPRCVGGNVNATGDPTVLRVTPKSGDASPTVWCYTSDILTGVSVLSNSVPWSGLSNSDSCAESVHIDGPPPGTAVNHNASCLRCIYAALSPCIRNEECQRHCGKEGCYNLVRSFQRKGNSLLRDAERKLGECSSDEPCTARALWQLTDGDEDCNGDGVVDCDDRFVRLLDPLCHLDSAQTETVPARGSYWSCRTSRTAEFVDILKRNKTARYFCSNNFNLGRMWDSPIYIDGKTIYNSDIFWTSTNKRMKQKEAGIKETEARDAFAELRALEKQNISLLPADVIEIAKNVSSLLKLNTTTLHMAQRAANASALPVLLDSLLTLAPPKVNLTEDDVAICKTSAIGVQLLSEQPLRGQERRFGTSPRLVPLTSPDDILKDTDKVEAAVIAPGLKDDQKLTVVVWANGVDFVSRGDEAIQDVQNETSDVSFNDTWVGGEKNISFFPVGPDVKFGCLSSHVMAVSLLENKTYVPLPEGKKVNITFSTTLSVLPGQKKICVHWIPEENAWADSGCKLVTDGGRSGALDTCECSHLTHFAQLVTDGVVITGDHAEVLHVLTICSCTISLLGLTGIIAAGIFAHKWRKKPENKVLVNLAAAVSASMALFLWPATAQRPSGVDWCWPPDAVCRLRGAFLHFFVLAGFCWMLVAASTHYVRLTRLTGVAGYSHFALKAALVGWGAPLLPVAALAAVDADAYAGANRDFCYPSGAAFYAAVLGPISLVLLVNLLMFILIIRQLIPNCCFPKSDKARLRRWGVDERRVETRIVLICTAFTFLFGLTWYLGLLSYSLVPAYVFCCVVALQGPALFVFFVVGEQNVRQRLKNICGTTVYAMGRGVQRAVPGGRFRAVRQTLPAQHMLASEQSEASTTPLASPSRSSIPGDSPFRCGENPETTM